jgi:DNA-binding NarL/FixJ family response regulator
MRILIADDHEIFRHGLRGVLADEFPAAEIGEAKDEQQTLDLAWKQKWDIVVLDITMPGRGGIEVLKEIKQARPKTPVLILSMHPEEEYATRVLKAGASGYITKANASKEVVGAIQKIVAGGKYVSSALAEKLATAVQLGAESQPHERLSDREYEVMRRIAMGKAVKEIASELSLSVQTVSTHRARLLKKMGLSNNAEVMRYAIRNKLVD